jgi:hypothetical protein
MKDIRHQKNVRLGHFLLLEITPYFGASRIFKRYSDVNFTQSISVTGFGQDQYNQDITSFVWNKNPQLQEQDGRLVNILQSASTVKGKDQTLSISMTGLPDDDMYDQILAQRLKWQTVYLWRGLFDENGAVIKESDTVTDIPPQQIFKGFVTQFSVTENYDNDTTESNSFITIECSSAMELFKVKTAGRKTNRQSQQRFFPSDVSMNRVTTIANTDFMFGFDEGKQT